MSEQLASFMERHGGARVVGEMISGRQLNRFYVACFFDFGCPRLCERHGLRGGFGGRGGAERSRPGMVSVCAVAREGPQSRCPR